MGRRRFGFFWSEIVDCQDSIECSLTKITAMEGDSYPPPSEMEVGNVAPEAMPVKSLVGDYSDSTSADVSHHQDHQDQNQHHGGDRQDEMDHQETPSFSNGNGNGGADEEQSKDDDDAPPKEPEQKPDPFDVFGKMLSSMPAKPADEEEEKESEAKNDEKNEDADEKNEDGDEKKDTFDKMFDSEKPSDENADDEKKDTFEKMFESDKPSEESEEKKDDQEEDTKPDALEKFKANEFGDETEENKTLVSEDTPAATTISADGLDEIEDNEDVVITDAITVNDKILSDEKYYEEMKIEEREALENALPTIDSFYDKLCCSVCAKKVDPIIGSMRGVLRHPTWVYPNVTNAVSFTKMVIGPEPR